MKTDFDELPEKSAEERERLDRIFREIEGRTPDDSGELASDLWELARLRDQYRS
jgi:hypothetical protein